MTESAYNYGLDFGGEVKGSVGDISGTFFFSALEKGGYETLTPLAVHSIDFKDGSYDLKKIEHPYISGYIEFKDRTDLDTAYTFTVNESADKPDWYVRGIYEYTLSTNTYALVKDMGELILETLAWNEVSQKLAYTFIDHDSTHAPLGGRYNLDHWTIAILDPITGEETEVAKGKQPMWSPDGNKLMFVASDGLKLYDTRTGVVQDVTGVSTEISGDPILGNALLDTSDDGSMLVWSNPRHNVIAVFEVVSWDAAEVLEIGRIQSEFTEYYWPIISPDAEYYIVQAIDQTNGIDEDRVNPRLEVRAVRDRTILQTIPLDDFEFMATFSDDWVRN